MRAAAPRSMKPTSPLRQGGLQGGFAKGMPTYPGAPRPRGVFSRLHLRATPPTERIFLRRR